MNTNCAKQSKRSQLVCTIRFHELGLGIVGNLVGNADLSEWFRALVWSTDIQAYPDRKMVWGKRRELELIPMGTNFVFRFAHNVHVLTFLGSSR